MSVAPSGETARTPVRLIGAPLDLGAGRRGVDMGPTALRIAGVTKTLENLGYPVIDTGNLHIPQREVAREGDTKLRFLDGIAEMCHSLYGAVREALTAGHRPLVLGGDHSLSIGSVSAVADHVHHSGGRLGVLWLDAHGDMNTPETTPSGNIHGMGLAALIGDGHPTLTHLGQHHPAVHPEDVALFGIRDIDEGEAHRIRASKMRACTMRDIDEYGVSRLLGQVLDDLLSRCNAIHVSLDVDFVDPNFAPGVGTPVRGGPTYREAHLIMEMLAECQRVVSVDVVEVNPVLDTHNTTATLAVDLIASLFGRQIL
ncbi:MAG: arginase [Myxococcota bacterium]